MTGETVREVAAALRAEARTVDERRLLVLAGDRDATLDAADEALDAAGIARAEATLVGPRDALGCERVRAKRADELLGTTRGAVVVDAHREFRPNALGRSVGAVDGGGLLLLLAPPLDGWPGRRDGFDATLAVPPYGVEDVSGHFRSRFVATLRAHPGIAIVDVDAGTVERDGLTRPAPRRPPPPPGPPGDNAFPDAAYEACLTGDQADALLAFERLRDPGRAVVVEADRGRGKSSAAGLAAGALAAEGRDVLVTAPKYRSAGEVFARAGELLRDLDAFAAGDREERPRRLDATGGGRIRFAAPTVAAEAAGSPAAVFVDEAAALPVRLLESFLAARSVAFTTTVHGYEGAGRGFSVRFRDRLAESDLAVTDVRLDAPIRYAAGDPVEAWAFRALLLDARPPVEPLVADATPGSVTYEALAPEDLLADEHRLREAFGLLVLAHYRTEPNDLARVLDAPNIAARALVHRGHVVSVALLAREGGLPGDVRRDVYEGGRVRGHMLPDVLTSQLRDEDAGTPEGMRVMRIATHHAVRSRGLGSRLLAGARAEFDDRDWLGVGYGATPDLLEFWTDNGFRTVQLSTTRNETSGEHSAIMLAPTSDAGRALHDRHARWFARRVASMLADPLRDLDPDVVRAALRSVEAPVDLDLDARDWRVVASAAHGPGLYDVAPGTFRQVVTKAFVDPGPLPEDALSAREERLLVRKVLQCHPWPDVTAELGYHSRGACMRALGEALAPLVDAYGDETAREERERYGRAREGTGERNG